MFQRQAGGGAQAVRIKDGCCETLKLELVWTKVNKSDDALVCFCLVCVNLLSLFEELLKASHVG